jgi:hypothetical protein
LMIKLPQCLHLSEDQRVVTEPKEASRFPHRRERNHVSQPSTPGTFSR